MLPIRISCALAALALLVPACISLEDIPRADGGQPAEEEEREGGESPDEGWPLSIDAGTTPMEGGGEQPRRDAGISLDASEGGPWVYPDAGGSGIACTRDDVCPRDEVCGPLRACIPRCDGYGRCIVASSPSGIFDLQTDDGALYWSVSQDLRQHLEIWRKQPGQPPRRLLDQALSSAFEVRAGILYLHRYDGLDRAPVSAPTDKRPLYTLQHPFEWTIGDSFVAIGTDEGVKVGPLDGSAPLKELWIDLWPQSGEPTKPHVDGDSVYFWDQVSSSSPVVLRSIRVGEEPATVRTPFSFTIASDAQNLFTEVRYPYLFARCERMKGICRYDLRDGTRFNVASWDEDLSYHAVIDGDWLYLRPDTFVGAPARLFRHSLVKEGVSQELSPPEGYPSDSAGRLAILGNTLYTVSAFGWDVIPAAYFLYELALPPAPCANDLPCAAGKSCGADMLCH